MSKKIKLKNGKWIKEGEKVIWINSDGEQVIREIKKRPHGNRAGKKGSLYFLNSFFHITCYNLTKI